ncbi:MAG: imidazoleglycerol-phosphate dehydratase, partial [Helicobacter sp.]|nr:imidazoleglycerol-phosphate dehydratase [Helicobacter sp.]
VHKRGHNRHHIIEAAFKSCALALRRALAQNARVQIPSTKGLL